MAALAANVRLRRELIERIAMLIETQRDRGELTLRELADTLGLAHPRVADLLARRAGRFSLDRLVVLAEELGLKVRIRATRPYGTGGSAD